MLEPSMPQSQQIEKIASPCIRNCCLNEQDICMGCFRHLSEITAWQELEQRARLQVLERCDERHAKYKLAQKNN